MLMFHTFCRTISAWDMDNGTHPSIRCDHVHRDYGESIGITGCVTPTTCGAIDGWAKMLVEHPPEPLCLMWWEIPRGNGYHGSATGNNRDLLVDVRRLCSVLEFESCPELEWC